VNDNEDIFYDILAKWHITSSNQHAPPDNNKSQKLIYMQKKILWAVAKINVEVQFSC
jgi:hypothetical protein